jgi:hypothetical protein
MKYVAVTLLLLSVALLALGQNPKVTAIRQYDCPIEVEQQENALDGPLKSADLKNRGDKTIDSIRIGWILESSTAHQATDVPGKIVELHPGLTAGSRVTVASGSMGMPSFPPNTNRVQFYVASGYFSDGKRFTCSAARPKSKD